MPRCLIATLTLTLLAFALVDSAMAQGVTGFRGTSDNPVGPTVSPYLNLLQSTQFGTTNYQSLVRPLIDQGNAINRQGSSINRLQQQVNSPAFGAAGRGGLQTTGHTTFFMNYSHYYPQPSAR